MISNLTLKEKEERISLRRHLPEVFR